MVAGGRRSGQAGPALLLVGAATVAKVVEQAVETGIATAGEARRLTREDAVGVAFRGVERREVAFDRAEIATRDRTCQRIRRAERECVLHRCAHQRAEGFEG